MSALRCAIAVKLCMCALRPVAGRVHIQLRRQAGHTLACSEATTGMELCGGKRVCVLISSIILFINF